MKNSIAALAVIVLSGSFLSAGVIPGRWDKVQTLNPGTPIEVRLQSGDRMACIFEGLSSEELTVTRYVGGELKLPRSEVAVIHGTENGRDNRANGTLIGFGIGAGSYLAAHAIACCPPAEAHDAGAALFFGGIGALVGFVADHFTTGPEVLYRSR